MRVNLNLEDVTVRLDRHDVLRGVDLGIQPGVTGLVGRNGAGKTTLIRTLAGVLRPTSGKVERDGQDIFAEPAVMRLHRRGLGWLPQEPGHPPGMTVMEFITYAAWLKEIVRSERRVVVAEALADVELAGLSGRRLGALSGGQRRRAALAAAMVGSPGLLLLDEPTNGLDPVQRSRFLEIVRKVAADRTVILATHLLEDLSLAADRWFTLDSGRIVGEGSLARGVGTNVGADVDAIRSSLSAIPAADQ